MEKRTRTVFGRIDINAPVILGMTLVSFLLLVLNWPFGGRLFRAFGAYYTSILDPLMYPRLLTHVLMHRDLSHFTGNFMMILAIGPMVEEKYGSRRLLWMIAVTALVTGLVHVLFSRGAVLMGASGVVFMLILLASFANLREGTIPLTVILVAALYLGTEIVEGVTANDAVSHISHILGGICGALFGFRFRQPERSV